MNRTAIILGIMFVLTGAGFADQAKLDKAIAKLKKGEIRAETLQEIEKAGKPAAKELRKLMRNKGMDRKTRVSAIVMMGKIKSTEDRQDLEDIVQNDTDAVEREAAAIALGHMGRKDAAPKLRQALKDPSGNVRMRAAKSLGKLGDSSGREAALEAMRGDDVTAKMLAADALEAIGDKTVIPELQKNLDDQNVWTRIYSKLAIKRIEAQGLGRNERMRYLQETLKDNQFEVNHWAAVKLAEDGSPKAIRILKETAKDNAIPGNRSAGKVLAMMVRTGKIKAEDMNK